VFAAEHVDELEERADVRDGVFTDDGGVDGGGDARGDARLERVLLDRRARQQASDLLGEREPRAAHFLGEHSSLRGARPHDARYTSRAELAPPSLSCASANGAGWTGAPGSANRDGACRRPSVA
jgi:hypothetical protein